ncbi:MAG: hypothetical protein KDA72_08325, partial [Planctomycetales bacterium]|nr:hypothetical protein [Planctomycetales bacterium]
DAIAQQPCAASDEDHVGYFLIVAIGPVDVSLGYPKCGKQPQMRLSVGCRRCRRLRRPRQWGGIRSGSPEPHPLTSSTCRSAACSVSALNDSPESTHIV